MRLLMRHAGLFLFLFAGLLLVILTSPAFAQAADTKVDFSPLLDALMPYLASLLGLLATALLGWLATLLKTKVGIDIDQGNRDALHSAIVTGINLGLSKIQPMAEGKLSVDVKNATVAQAATWAEKSVPGAIAHFGLTPDALRDMIAAKLNIADPGTPSVNTTAPVASAS